ncbi:MAG: hydrogenase 3 maturation endopeptidase HyCI [Chloroflexota bacterium]|nr:hydrogenase 3 maturation endopeptidase HyCI [Anaerolineales bacterium]
MPSTWRTALSLLLKQLTSEAGRSLRIAVLGIGNLMRSDDAAGMLVARALSQCEAADNVLILEGGPAPENQTADLRKFAPDLVLLIDAADMGKATGAVDWISEDDIDGMSASTHSLPLSMLVKFLTLDLGCQVKLLGIQAASNEVGEVVSPEVLQAVEEVTAGLDEAICTI